MAKPQKEANAAKLAFNAARATARKNTPPEQMLELVRSQHIKVADELRAPGATEKRLDILRHIYLDLNKDLQMFGTDDKKPRAQSKARVVKPGHLERVTPTMVRAFYPEVVAALHVEGIRNEEQRLKDLLKMRAQVPEEMQKEFRRMLEDGRTTAAKLDSHLKENDPVTMGRELTRLLAAPDKEYDPEKAATLIGKRANLRTPDLHEKFPPLYWTILRGRKEAWDVLLTADPTLIHDIAHPRNKRNTAHWAGHMGAHDFLRDIAKRAPEQFMAKDARQNLPIDVAAQFSPTPKETVNVIEALAPKSAQNAARHLAATENLRKQAAAQFNKYNKALTTEISAEIEQAMADAAARKASDKTTKRALARRPQRNAGRGTLSAKKNGRTVAA